MHCVIRLNAYPELGNGHLMRCLTLARKARELNHRVLFILGDYPGSPVTIMQAAGFDYALVPILNEEEDAAWCAALIKNSLAPCRVVVDVYAFSGDWHRIVYPECTHLLVIDDLANRPYYCDVLLDQTPGRTQVDYATLVAPFTQVFAGCEHALLAPEFFAAVKDAKTVRDYFYKRKAKPRLLVSLGGTDPKAFSLLWFDLLASHAHEFAVITFLLASNALAVSPLAKKIAEHPIHLGEIKLLVDARCVADLLLTHDLAIGGAGVSALERALLGMPSLLLILADNQVKQAQALNESGCAITLGDWQRSPNQKVMQEALRTVLAVKNDYRLYQSLSSQAFKLIATEQPYQAITEFLTSQRVQVQS